MDSLKSRALSLELEPTNLCNTQCLHCPHDSISRPYGKMDWETYHTIVDKAANFSDSLYVGFAGMGEPLLNPLIYQFVGYAHEKAAAMVTSNASALTAQNMEKLISAGLDTLIISFNGPNKALYELMMGGLNFEKAQKNLDDAIHLGQGTSTDILINISVTRQTEGHLEEIRSYFLDRGIQSVIFSKCHSRGGFLKGDLVCRTPLPPTYNHAAIFLRIPCLSHGMGTHYLVVTTWLEKTGWGMQKLIPLKRSLLRKMKFRNQVCRSRFVSTVMIFIDFLMTNRQVKFPYRKVCMTCIRANYPQIMGFLQILPSQIGCWQLISRKENCPISSKQ